MLKKGPKETQLLHNRYIHKTLDIWNRTTCTVGSTQHLKASGSDRETLKLCLWKSPKNELNCWSILLRCLTSAHPKSNYSAGYLNLVLKEACQNARGMRYAKIESRWTSLKVNVMQRQNHQGQSGVTPTERLTTLREEHRKQADNQTQYPECISICII